jgi:hypothetical protein
MNITLRMTLAFLIIAGFAGLTSARGVEDQINIADLASHPETFSGRVIEVSAQVIAISADAKSLELFDSQTRTRIDVRLTQLRKADRIALIHSNVRRVTVTGRVVPEAGRLTIEALKVQPIALAQAKGDSSSKSGDADQP